MGGETTRAAEVALLDNLRRGGDELRQLLSSSSDHWGFEDPLYRLYHHSFKVYSLQERTREIVEALRSLAPDRSLHPLFELIVEEGTGRKFAPEHNAQWARVSRPIVEAFFHAGSFLRGEAGPVSDVDFLVDFDPSRKSFDNLLALASLLERLLGRRVELVTREGLSPYIGPAILPLVAGE
jgi:predicted nucleotidyltransferase